MPNFKTGYGKQIFAFNGTLPVAVHSEEDVDKFKDVEDHAVRWTRWVEEDTKTLVNICSRTKDEQAQLYKDASSTKMRSTNFCIT